MMAGKQLLTNHNKMVLESDGVVVEKREVCFVHLGFEIGGPNGLGRVSRESIQQKGGVGIIAVCLSPVSGRRNRV